MGFPFDFLSENGVSDHEKGLTRLLTPDFIVKYGKHVLSLLGRYLPKPGGFYLTFYKTHVGCLLSVGVAVLRGQSIKQYIAELQANLSAYLREADEVAKLGKGMPIDPFAGISNEQIEQLIKTPLGAQAYESILNSLEKRISGTLEAVEACLESGRKIQESTAQKIDELQGIIDQLPDRSAPEVIVKLGLVQDLQFFQLAVEDDLIAAIGHLEDALLHMYEVAAAAGVR